MPRWYKMLLMPKAVNDNGEIKGFKYAGIPVFVNFRGLYDSNLKGTEDYKNNYTKKGITREKTNWESMNILAR